VLEEIRQLAEGRARTVAVLADLAGSKIRLGELPGGAIECQADAEFRFVSDQRATGPDVLHTSFPSLVDELAVGNLVMLADGTVAMAVLEKGHGFVRCRVTQPGTIRSRQGVNVPGVKLSLPALGRADRDAVEWASHVEVDFLGQSFVRSPDDVRELKSLVAGATAPQVVAKIEKREALDSLEEIVGAADGVMVARGDLGVEIDVAEMPIVQKRIIAACRQQQKPVIVATQMLESMQASRRPTRAEVTDVANAILDGGDACMLSAETAIGRYPREAVAMMNRIALATERLFRDNVPQPPGSFRIEGLRPVTAAVVYGAGHIAAELDAKLIVVATHSGATALALSKQRNYVPTIGISDQPRTLRRLCLYWGVIPLAGVPTENCERMLAAVTEWGRQEGELEPGDYLVLVGGTGIRPDSHNEVIVHQVG
jgi:pyruvate kinase